MEQNFERIKAKNKRRRIRKNTFYIFIAVVIIVLFLVIGYENFFDIKKISVQSQTPLHITDGEIISAAGIALGDNLLSLDEDSAEGALITAYPYFESVEFEKTMPSELTIIPKIQKGFMYINIGGDCFIISDACRALEKVDDPFYDGYHRTEVKVGGVKKCICGEDIIFEDADTAELIATIWSAIMSKNVSDKIVSFDITDKFNMKLNYDNRLTAVLGNYEYMQYKIALFVKVARDELNERDYGTVDVTDTNGAIVSLTDKNA